MKKKVLFLLLPLTLTMTSCGKDVDANVAKVDLARLLSDDEITEVLEKAQDSFSNKLSLYEANMALLATDLINEKREATAYASYKIKGDEYAEGKLETETKIQNNFYTYTDKAVTTANVAAFGNYYITYEETIKNGLKEDKADYIEYINKGSQTIADASASFPITSNDLNKVTFGVDRANTVYAVYSSETISTQEGHDQSGKDCIFKTKTTNETSIKLGNLKDPKIESYKTVQKVEQNFDEELKIYSKYQVTTSYVTSFKFEYKNRGNNDGKDKFIDSLPEQAIQSLNVSVSCYSGVTSGTYSKLYDDVLTLTGIKPDYLYGSIVGQSKINISKLYAYGFVDSYYALTIDKKYHEISSTVKSDANVNLNAHPDFDIVSTENGPLYKLKDDLTDKTYIFKFKSDGNTLNVSII